MPLLVFICLPRTIPNRRKKVIILLGTFPGDLEIKLLFAQVKHFINQDFLCHISGLTGYTA